MKGASLFLPKPVINPKQKLNRSVVTANTELLTQKLAAEILGFHPITLWKHRIDWQIPHTTLPNGQVRYPRSQIMGWIADRTARTAAELAVIRDGRRTNFCRGEAGL